MGVFFGPLRRSFALLSQPTRHNALRSTHSHPPRAQRPRLSPQREERPAAPSKEAFGDFHNRGATKAIQTRTSNAPFKHASQGTKEGSPPGTASAKNRDKTDTNPNLQISQVITPSIKLHNFLGASPKGNLHTPAGETMIGIDQTRNHKDGQER